MVKISYQIGLLLILFLIGCKSSKTLSVAQEEPKVTQATPSQLNEDKKIEFEYLFIEGLKQKMAGNFEEAVKYFNGCLELDPASAATLYEIAKIHVAKGELISAKLVLEKAIQINPDNKWYQLLLAQIYQNNKQYSEASKIYDQLISNEPDNLDYYYMNAILLTSAKQYNDAIKAYDELEEKAGFNEQISLARQQLYQEMGKKKDAYAEIEKLIENDPTVPEYYGVLADMYKDDGQMNKALENYNKVLDIDPNNGFVHFSLANLFLQNNQLDEAYSHAEKGFASPDIAIDTKIQFYLMISSAPDEIRFSDGQIEKLIALITQTHPDDARSYSIQADYYLNNNKNEEARVYMEKALETDPNSYPLWEQLIIIDNQLEDYPAMIEHCKKAIEFFPMQPMLYVLNAVGDIQLKKYNEAIISLETGMQYVADNKRLEAQFELYRAEAYYNLNDSDKAFSSFEKVIQIEPDNYMAMNNYAYYLSVRGEQLEKAELLSSRVVQANPDNPTYLDTHAWVLFKKKEYRLAKFYMETALKNGGDDNEVVMEHYGDILFMLNDVDNAIVYWQKSLDMGNTSETLKQKIKERKFIEGEE